MLPPPRNTLQPPTLPELPLKYRRKAGQNMPPIFPYRESTNYYSASSSPLSSSSYMHSYSPASSPVHISSTTRRDPWDSYSSSPIFPRHDDALHIAKRPRLDRQQPPFLYHGEFVEDEPPLMSDVEPSEFSEDNDMSFMHDDDHSGDRHEDEMGPDIEIVDSPILAFDGTVQGAHKESDVFRRQAYRSVNKTDVDIANTLLDFSREARITAQPYSHGDEGLTQKRFALPPMLRNRISDPELQMRTHSVSEVSTIGPDVRRQHSEHEGVGHVNSRGTEGAAAAGYCRKIEQLCRDYEKGKYSRSLERQYEEYPAKEVEMDIQIQNCSDTSHKVSSASNAKSRPAMQNAPARSIEIIDLGAIKHASALSQSHEVSDAPVTNRFRTSSSESGPSTSSGGPEYYANLEGPEEISEGNSFDQVVDEIPQVARLSPVKRIARSASPSLPPSPAKQRLHFRQHKTAEPELRPDCVYRDEAETPKGFVKSETAVPIAPLAEPIESISALASTEDSLLPLPSDISKDKHQDDLPKFCDEESRDAEQVSVSQERLSNAETQEIRGLLIQAMAVSRASSLPASSLLREIMHDAPHLSKSLMEAGMTSQRSKKLWLKRINEILDSHAEFGRIDRNGNDAAGKPLEPHWFYIPEKDDDQERAALLVEMMPKKRNETKKHKQYYYQPLGKVSRWDPEDEP